MEPTLQRRRLASDMAAVIVGFDRVTSVRSPFDDAGSALRTTSQGKPFDDVQSRPAGSQTVHQMLKRVFDLVAAIIGLIALSPILAVVAGLVRLTSAGPAFFRQTRVGRNGRDFVLWKMRTMVEEKAESRKRKAESGDGQRDSGRFDAGDTSRVTPVGQVLRKWKLDELPQLWNVLAGDMSLVGPRPEVRKWVEVYPERWAKVLTVRPGITDPASIEFRNEEEILAKSADPERTYREEILPRKLDLYERYVATRSFWGDVGILLKTVWAVVGR